ncbi:MHYT domain-containing protein [Neptunomonas phycophila]|uniref:MHYT domain-containing protein n=1 Tax=Neptunomonas phycophila TaxID=1572645 RepID=UPI0035150CAD
MIIEQLSHYFSNDYDPSFILPGSYNYWLVALSVLIATFTSTMSLHLVAISINNNSHVYQKIAILTSGIAMGCGIWAMHFIGMIAYHLPTAIYYDPYITLLSLLPGIIACCVALYLTARKEISTQTLIAGGIILGSGIGIMHYTGMQAMQMGPMMRYDPAWFLASIVIAVLLAITALLTQFKLRKYLRNRPARVITSGCILGAAISCMHYVGMNSAIFIGEDSYQLDTDNTETLTFIGIATALVTIAVTMFVAATNWLIRYRQLLGEVSENESRLEAILETAVDGIITIDDSGIVQDFNPAAERIFGWKHSDILGKPVQLLVPKADQKHNGESFLQCNSDRKTSLIGSETELMAQHISGALIPIRLSVGEITLNDGSQRYVGFVTDISHRHQIEKELRQNEAQLSSLMNNMPGVAFRCTLDENWSMLFINDAVEVLTGWPVNAFINGKIHFSDIIHPDDIDLAIAAVASPQKERTYTVEYRIRHRKGHIIWLLDRGTIHMDESGEPEWIDGLLFDISERRQMEEILREAKIKAEAAVEAKASFMANMSHEIRTPMNAIIGFSDILSDTPLQIEQSKYLNSISSAAKSLLHLLNDILDTAKLEKGKLDLEETDFSLYELVDSVISTLWIQARSKKLALNFHIEKEVETYYRGAPDRIRQVLMNLIGNALKFTDEGSVDLNIYLSPNGKVCFDIADTGIGISQDRIDAIFDPFTQADASMSRRFGGTGLGTTISKQLVELMGGKIYAKSSVGKGSTFSFTLPLTSGKATNNEQVLSAYNLPPLHILAADDIPQNIELLTIIMTRQGHKVTSVSDGLEAVEAVKKEKFDVVLMDVQMPNMDGLTASTTIRAYEKAHEADPTPIIALTASVLNEDKIAAYEAGMTGFATKPINIDLLNAEIARVTGLHLTPPSTPAPPPTDKQAAIQHDKGLSLWGDISLYTQELTKFAKQNESHFKKTEQLIEEADFDALKHHTHALKGVSGNLALPFISSRFAELESAAQQTDIEAAQLMLPTIKHEFARFKAELTQLCDSIENDLKASKEDADIAEFTPSLFSLLKHAESGEINDQLIEKFLLKAPSKYKNSAKNIANAFADFEFEDALKMLKNLSGQIDNDDREPPLVQVKREDR